ncbi:MAG TPA: TolC family protein [Sulfuriferula sp.]|nr:TolC family protein [Sulfuriferula sp.]
MNEHPRLRAAATVVAAGFLAGAAIPAMAGQADPFSTQGLAASSAAGSTQRPLLAIPCENIQPSQAPLALADVVERALCNNPQTHEAWANARFQAAQVGIGKSAYLPSISIGGAETRNRTDGGNSFASGSTTTYSQQSLSASLSYLLYDFGARDAALENAKQILAAANDTQDATIQSVFLAAVQAYYQLFATQAAVASAREAEKSAQESFNAAAARYNVGSGTPADKLQAQTALSQAVLNRIRAQGDFSNAQGQLANSMGLDANQPVAVTPPALAVPDAQFVRNIGKLIEEARRLRPDLAAAEAQVNAARASAEAARAAGMPTISVAANVNRSYTNLTDPFSSSSLGVLVNFPLFTGYNTTYRIRAAQAQIDTSLAQRERLSQQVALDVWKAYQGVVTETQAVKSANDLVASAVQSERVALGRYKAGVGNLLDLLTAQSALASARMQNIQAIYNWHIAKATLAQAMGRLDFSTLETSASQTTSP